MSQKSLASVVFSGILWACSGGASDPLVESCSGRYTCMAGATTVETTLVKQTNGCFAGEIRLGSDHVATLPSGRQGSWAGSVERFDVCEGSDCVVCTASSPIASEHDASRDSHTPSCHQPDHDAGAGPNCASFGKDLEQCAFYGCSTYHIDSGVLACDGHPAGCGSYATQDDCVARSFCVWD